MKAKLLIVLILITLLLPTSTAVAQTEPDLPVYIIQPGDNLYSIAVRFGLELNTLIEANQFADPNNLKVGDAVKIPGYEGLQGTISGILVQPGQTFRDLALLTNANIVNLSRLSRITSPMELYIGTEIFSIEPAENLSKTALGVLNSAQSLEEVAIVSGANPWSLFLSSRYASDRNVITGDSIFTIGDSTETTFANVSPYVEIEPLPLVQGRSFTITLNNATDAEIQGEFNGQPLTFHKIGSDALVTLAGIHAMQEPGLVPLSIKAFDGREIIYELEQNVLLQSGNYISETVYGVDSYTIEAETIQEENDILATLVVNTDTKYWTTNFSYPVDEPYLGSTFGRRRTYNGSYNYYHTGQDFTVYTANNLNIYAAAPGKVIFSDILPIKGLFTIIDHGWGVYSGYAHQSESLVSPGQMVNAADLIGIIGNSGRSVGPHLHWEVWVNGIPVDPLQWIEQNIPESK